eukprot:scaffold122302_cov39-Tisochrysis_lutea.AAC.5
MPRKRPAFSVPRPQHPPSGHHSGTSGSAAAGAPALVFTALAGVPAGGSTPITLAIGMCGPGGPAVGTPAEAAGGAYPG